MLRRNFSGAASRGNKWNCSGRKANEYEYRCVWPCGRFPQEVFPESPSRNISSASAAVAGLVLGCAWTVYTNIFAASVYPSMGSAAFDAPVVKRSPRSRRVRRRRRSTRCLPRCPPRRRISTPESVQLRLCLTKGLRPPRRRANRRGSPPLQRAGGRGPSLSRRRSRLRHRSSLKRRSHGHAETADRARQAGAEVRRQSRSTARPHAEPNRRENPGTSVRDMAQRAKAAVMSIASGEKQNMVEKLWGKREPSRRRCCPIASADASVTGSIPSTLAQNPMLGGSPPYDRQTAVYDICAHTVYLPDGTRLEAHSGLGSGSTIRASRT